MKAILVIGNAVDELDSLALHVIEQVKNDFPAIQFLSWDPTEELPEGIGRDIVLIDAIQGIDTVTVFNGLHDFVVSPRNTVHDFDLSVALRLMQKIGRIQKITIIGLPYGEKVHAVRNQLITCMKSLNTMSS